MTKRNSKKAVIRSYEDEPSSQPDERGKLIPAVGFTSLEKNLASLGFFTASTKRARQLKEKKITLMRRETGNEVVEATATILPSSKYGLPITADQDKYLAFLKIVADIRRRDGRVENPVSFTSAQLLKLLNMTSAGKNYDEIDEWLNRMTLTGINSMGVVFLAGRRRWAKAVYHVFDKAVSSGKELPDGTVANRNFVWLSEWQLENINQNYLLPIDLDSYTRIRNRIAKTLVPLLQIWLYASQRDGRFVKRYTELCDVINVARYKHLSKIKEKWGPSLDELTAHGYLAGWEVQRTVADDDFKIVFIHGPRFLKAEALPSDSQEAEPLTYGSNDELHDLGALEEDLTEGDLVAELTARGVTRRVAKTLLRDLPEPVQAERFLEWADREIERVAPENTAGFLVYLIREHVAPPPDFLSRRQLREVERQDASARRVDAERVRRVERYESYVEGEVDKYLASLTPEDYEARVREKAVQLKARFNVLRTAPTETVQESARRAFRAEVAKELALLPFDAFESGPVDA